jgi:radical SAM protein with 4Fe4S-binding SPASM domain
MNEATYSAFSLGVHQRTSGKRVPMEVTIEVTRRCPLECLHCYNNLPMSDTGARAQELTLEEHCKLLDELSAAGCLWLCYTGGEIFARKDFLDIYREAKKRGFLITLFTNGTLITPRVADYLAEWQPFSIEITLYGATRETYEALTRIPGSYDRCIRGIRLLLERGLPLKLKTVPTTINKHEVYEMKRMAEEDFHVEFKFDSLINPRIDCSQSPVEVRLSPEDAVALDYFDPRRRSEYVQLLERLVKTPAPSSAGHGKYACGGGQQGCAIDPVGTMTICVISHQQGYNIRQGSFQEGWEGPLREIRQQKRTRPTICDGCRIRSSCGMCAATAELENGDAESPVAFLCEVAHLRAYALGFDVPAHGQDCACCKGGARHEAILAAAKRIREQQTNAGSWSSTGALHPGLNILQSSSGCHNGACGSCTAHGV